MYVLSTAQTGCWFHGHGRVGRPDNGVRRKLELRLMNSVIQAGMLPRHRLMRYLLR